MSTLAGYRARASERKRPAQFEVERLDIFDVRDDDDPELHEKIKELHRRRNELNPEIAGMLADAPACTGSDVEGLPGFPQPLRLRPAARRLETPCTLGSRFGLDQLADGQGPCCRQGR